MKIGQGFLGYLIVDISSFQGGLETEHACPFLAGNESESWESTFRKLVNEKKVNEPKALWVKVCIYITIHIIIGHRIHKSSTILELNDLGVAFWFNCHDYCS